jgi:putative RecB family exonuclease
MISKPQSLSELRKTPHWSFSSINALANFCSLAWAYKYVYRVEPLHTPVNLVFGSVFHSALDFWAVRMFEGEDCSPEDLDAVFADLLTDECRSAEPPVKFPESEDLYSLIEKGQRMLRTYVEAFDPEDRVLGIGVPFSVPLIDAAGETLAKPLIGEFDLTVERDGLFTIVDWKTAARKWPESKALTDLQPTCYLWAHSFMTGDMNALFRFDVVTKTKTPACEQHVTKRTPADFTRLAERVRVLERMVEHDCFQPDDQSWECKDCPFSLECQSWQRERARTHVHFELAA